MTLAIPYRYTVTSQIIRATALYHLWFQYTYTTRYSDRVYPPTAYTGRFFQ